jgi:hypothetical protein
MEFLDLEERTKILEKSLELFSTVTAADIQMHDEEKAKLINDCIQSIVTKYSISSMHHPKGVIEISGVVFNNLAFRDHVLSVVEQFRIKVGVGIFNKLTSMISEYTFHPPKGDWKSLSEDSLMLSKIPLSLVELRYPQQKDIISFYESNPFYIYFPMSALPYNAV